MSIRAELKDTPTISPAMQQALAIPPDVVPSTGAIVAAPTDAVANDAHLAEANTFCNTSPGTFAHL